MAETLLDFSNKISDYEYVTQSKIENIVEALNIDHVFIKNMDQKIIQEYVIVFPKKVFFFTVTLYGGGSSGIKSSYSSNTAMGGYSSGTIVRFPIEINNESGSHFARVRIGRGGEGFDISEKIILNNGEYSNFDLVLSNETSPEPYKTEKGRTNVNILEGLSSYGSGKLIDGTIIEGTSTNTYFSFNGANSQNTFVRGSNNEHRNFYSPYLDPHNGYNSFIGVGGEYLGDINGEENTGAGGAGVYNNSSKKVGKGGNGGCIIEYEGKDKLEVYAENYLFISNNNKLVFIIYDQGTGSRNIEIVFQGGVYSIIYLIEYIKSFLNQSVAASVSQIDSKMVIKMMYPWSIDIGKSSGDLLIDLGIMNTDIYQNNKIKSATLVNGLYELPFSKQITSICKLNYFNMNQIFS